MSLLSSQTYAWCKAQQGPRLIEKHEEEEETWKSRCTHAIEITGKRAWFMQQILGILFVTPKKIPIWLFQKLTFQELLLRLGEKNRQAGEGTTDGNKNEKENNVIIFLFVCDRPHRNLTDRTYWAVTAKVSTSLLFSSPSVSPSCTRVELKKQISFLQKTPPR